MQQVDTMPPPKGVLPKVFAPVFLVLGFLIAGAFLLLMRDVLERGRPPATRPAKGIPAAPAAEQAAPLEAYRAVLRDNPFRIPAGELTPLSAPAERPAQGGIPAAELRLVGTISGPRTGWAVFADKDGRQWLFRTGETVFEAGILAKVRPDRVWIRAGATAREIPLTEETPAAVPTGATPRAAVADFARKIGRTEYMVDQKAVQQALDHPNQIMTDARLLPHFRNDRQEGFIVREIRKNGIYDGLGLQNGDVLLQVNDLNISSPETAMQAFAALRGMDRVKLDILRNGAAMTMTYQIR